MGSESDQIKSVKTPAEKIYGLHRLDIPNSLPATNCLHILYFDTGKGGGGWRVEPEIRLEGQQFTKLSRKYQHD